MTMMSPALDAALAGINPTVFGAIEIVLPNHTIRLLTGSGIITFAGKTFTGSDATYGALYSIENITDGGGDEAPAVELTFVPASNAAAADLASASMQGSQVTFWLGAVDPASGGVIGDPLMIFLGSLDVAKLKVAKNSRLLEMEITSVFEDFFFTDDGARLSDTFHKFLWPGETGLQQAVAVTRQIYWGSAPPSGVSRVVTPRSVTGSGT